MPHSQLITPGRVENAGTATSGIAVLLSYFTLSEYLAIGTFAMGVITFIIGRIYNAKDRRIKEIQAALDEQHKRLQIEREQIEIETRKAELKGFKVKKKVKQNVSE